MKDLDYPFMIRHLSDEDGGGYLIEFPDLPGCMSDGDTIDETIKNGEDAVIAWIAAAKESGRDIPKPSEIEEQSGKWVQRVPKSLHSKLVRQAKREGVSLNMLVVSMIAESLGEKTGRVPFSPAGSQDQDEGGESSHGGLFPRRV